VLDGLSVSRRGLSVSRAASAEAERVKARVTMVEHDTMEDIWKEARR
jgi:hypothetical protein